MDAYLVAISGWDWLGAAAIIFIADMLLIGGYLLFIALGALLTGVFALIAPALSWEIQCMIFAVCSGLLAPWLARRAAKRRKQNPNVNNISSELIGNVVQVSGGGIINGQGRVIVGDSSWIAKSDSSVNCPAGSSVRIVQRQGIVLVVEPVEPTASN